jgi:hypothetical protein
MLIFLIILLWIICLKPKESFSMRQTKACSLDSDQITTECSREILLKDFPNIIKAIGKKNKLSADEIKSQIADFTEAIKTDDNVVNNIVNDTFKFSCLNNTCVSSLKSAIKKVISSPPTLSQIEQMN